MTAHTTAPAFPRRRFLWSSSSCYRKPGRRRNVRDPEFVDLVAWTNVSMAVKQIQEQSPAQELEKKGALKRSR